MSDMNWYVVHTYSGYGKKVKDTIDQTIRNRKDLQDQILEVRIPLQEVIEVKDGVKKNVAKKMFPGYVLVHMINNTDTWYIIRNTRGVTGFVGQVQGSDPIPLTDAELRKLGIYEEEEREERQDIPVEIDFGIGDLVEIVYGALQDHRGVVKDINMNKQTVTIQTEIFQDFVNDVEIGFLDVKKV